MLLHTVLGQELSALAHAIVPRSKEIVSRVKKYIIPAVGCCAQKLAAIQGVLLVRGGCVLQRARNVLFLKERVDDPAGVV